MIDIKRIFVENNIRFIESGNNVSKGNINIRCPLCGPDDHSEHMGIRLADGAWGCWRDTKHRGKNLARLFQILNIPYIEEHKEVLTKLLNKTLFEQEAEKLIEQEPSIKYTKLPTYFVSIADNSVFDKLYLKYLERRGFDQPTQVAEYYNLCRSLAAGKWSARLIAPISIKDEYSFIGRSIGNSEPRYLTPTNEEAKNIKHCIFNYNELINSTGEILLIGEGIFDAIKTDWFLKPKIRATCIFGLLATQDQIKLLHDLCLNFNTIIIALDEGTLPQALLLSKQLDKFSPLVVKLPKKDLGELNKHELLKLVQNYL